MSQYVDRVKDSPALANLRQAEEVLSELSERDWQHQTTKDLINRLTVVVKHVLGRMTIVDRNLVTESSLNNPKQSAVVLFARLCEQPKRLFRRSGTRYPKWEWMGRSSSGCRLQSTRFSDSHYT